MWGSSATTPMVNANAVPAIERHTPCFHTESSNDLEDTAATNEVVTLRRNSKETLEVVTLRRNAMKSGRRARPKSTAGLKRRLRSVGMGRPFSYCSNQSDEQQERFLQTTVLPSVVSRTAGLRCAKGMHEVLVGAGKNVTEPGEGSAAVSSTSTTHTVKAAWTAPTRATTAAARETTKRRRERLYKMRDHIRSLHQRTAALSAQQLFGDYSAGNAFPSAFDNLQQHHQPHLDEATMLLAHEERRPRGSLSDSSDDDYDLRRASTSSGPHATALQLPDHHEPPRVKIVAPLAMSETDTHMMHGARHTHTGTAFAKAHSNLPALSDVCDGDDDAFAEPAYMSGATPTVLVENFLGNAAPRKRSSIDGGDEHTTTVHHTLRRSTDAQAQAQATPRCRRSSDKSSDAHTTLRRPHAATCPRRCSVERKSSLHTTLRRRRSSDTGLSIAGNTNAMLAMFEMLADSSETMGTPATSQRTGTVFGGNLSRQQNHRATVMLPGRAATESAAMGATGATGATGNGDDGSHAIRRRISGTMKLLGSVVAESSSDHGHVVMVPPQGCSTGRGAALVFNPRIVISNSSDYSAHLAVEAC